MSDDSAQNGKSRWEQSGPPPRLPHSGTGQQHPQEPHSQQYPQEPSVQQPGAGPAQSGGWNGGAASAQPGEAVGAPSPQQLDSQRSKRKRRWVVITVVVLLLGVLVGGGLIARAYFNSTQYGPEARAKAYLQAVVDGDVDTAFSIYDPNLSTDQRALLTSEVFDAASARPTAFQIDRTSISGDTATVNANLTIDSKSYPTTLSLQKTGHQSVVFDKWEFTDGGLQKIEVRSPGAVATVNGVGVQLGSADEVSVLPGVYTFAPQQNSQYVTFGAPVTVKALPGEGDDVSVSFTESWSQLGRDYAINQVKSRIEGCMQSDRFEPDGCRHLKMDDPGSYAVTGITRWWSSQPSIMFKDDAVSSSPKSSYGPWGTGSGSSGASGSDDVDSGSSSTTGSVVLTGGDMHIDYQWRYSSGDEWEPDSRVEDGVFDYTTVVPVSIGADGTPQLDFSSF